MWPVCSLSVRVLLLVAVIHCSEVFMDQPSASQVLSLASRRRRSNSPLEELLPGDLERECNEEVCNQEEAAEIFQSTEQMLEFWLKYSNLKPCASNPCLNGGICTLERDRFLCLCPPPYRGKICETVVLECRYKNGGCAQYCEDLPRGAGVQCGCAEGYELQSDSSSCSKTVLFPCGLQQRELLPQYRTLLPNSTSELSEVEFNSSEPQEEKLLASNVMLINHTAENHTELPTFRMVGANLDSQGGSPWQVLIHRSDGYGFCGGSLVSDRWVVTAAHCLEDTADHVTVGDFDKRLPDPGEQLIKVQQVFVHPLFNSETFDSDVALLLLERPISRGPASTPACLPDQHLASYLLQDGIFGKVTGWGVTHFLGRTSRFLRQVTLPVVTQAKCRASTDEVVTDNMFCAGHLEAGPDACSGDSGGPFTVHYRNTWFLVGVVSWGERCGAQGKYGIYTRLGNFLGWMKEIMENKKPLEPLKPLGPLLPLEPLESLEPLKTLEPLKPLGPLGPLEPLEPLEPLLPLKPLEPLGPLKPLEPRPE